MKITKETKKFLVEFLSRAAQVLFATVVVGPFVTGNIKLLSMIMGIVGMAGSLIMAFFIAQTIKEEIGNA